MSVVALNLVDLWGGGTIYIYIYIYGHPPYGTHTPEKNCKNRYKRRFFPNPFLELVLQIENTSVEHKNQEMQKPKNPKMKKSKNPKFQKSKNPKIPKYKNPKTIARFRRCKKKFWIFGFLVFRIFGCLNYIF